MPKQVYVINPISGAMQDKLPVAAYCRVSSNSDDQRHSYYAQVKAYTEQIESNPEWTLAGIYADPGITGTSAAKRKEFQRLMKDCRAGKVKRILVKSVSRFARNTKECLEYVRELKMLGVSVYFEDKKIDTATFSSEMMLAMFGSIAQEESVSISNNMRWSYERRMQSGEFNTCFAPFGFRIESGKLVVFQEEAEIVKWIFNSYLNGLSRTRIAELLTEKNISTRGKKDVWTKRTIDYILANERYMGDALLNKRYSSDGFPPKAIRNKGGQPQYYIENANPAIIGMDAFMRAQELRSKRFSHVSSQENTSPLRKRILCLECGSTFRRKIGKSGRVTWVCYQHESSSGDCVAPPIVEEAVTQAFFRMFELLRVNNASILTPMCHQLGKLREKAVQCNEDASVLNKTILTVNGQIHALNRLRTKGFMEPAVFQEKQNELAAQLEKAQKQREMLLSDDDEDKFLDRTEELIEILEHAPENLASLEDSEVFSMMVDKVLINKNKKIIFRLINGLELAGDGGVVNGQE